MDGLQTTQTHPNMFVLKRARVVYCKVKFLTTLGTLPGMWERTITIGSAGKTFSVTGWKIGWAYGPSELIHNLHMVHQNCVYTCPTPIQVDKIAYFLRFL